MKVAHLTTVDLSLRFLVFPQLKSIVANEGDAIGISAPGPWVPELTAAGIRHLPLPTSTRGMAPLADLRAAMELWRILRRERPDILHTHNPKPGLYGRLLGRLAGVPMVVNTVHGLYATPDDPFFKRALVYSLEAIAARFSDAELVQNPEDLALMRKWRMAPAARVSLLGNGIDLRRFRPAQDSAERDRIRAELGVGPEQVAIGIVGRLVAEKGYPELFEAARQLPANFVILAIGPEDADKPDALPPAMIARARESGVQFLGMRTDVEVIYRALDIFVLPSHREGFPRTAMEAAASGLPIVATDIRGCREVVEDGINGLLVAVRDPRGLAKAITTLGQDRELSQRMAAAGVELARRRFDEAVVVERVLDAYRKVAIRKGHAAVAGALASRGSPVKVRRATPTEARTIARLHAETITTGFLSTLGAPFLARLYRALIAWPEAVVLVADAGSVPVGFVAGVSDTRAFYRHFLRRYGLGATLVAVPSLRRPAAMKKAFETLRYQVEDDSPRAELLSMGVGAKWQGQGIGTALGKALLSEALMSGPMKVVVGAANLVAIRAYERMGFRPHSRIEVHRGEVSSVLVSPGGGG